jgi:methionine-rich copper-binding protein CopC
VLIYVHLAIPPTVVLIGILILHLVSGMFLGGIGIILLIPSTMMNQAVVPRRTMPIDGPGRLYGGRPGPYDRARDRGRTAAMMRRRSVIVGSGAVLAGSPVASWAQGVRVLDSAPKANAVIDGRSSAFYVRFDRPVDHADSRLALMRHGKVIEILHPRLESAPEVLFARAPTLPPGAYALHWRVGGVPQLEGQIPFTVSGG